MRQLISFFHSASPLRLTAKRPALKHWYCSHRSPNNMEEVHSASKDSSSDRGDAPAIPSERSVSDAPAIVTGKAGAKRRSRPPLDYTNDFETPTSIDMNVIGVVRSPYKERFGTPRQPNVTENTLGNKQQAAHIQLYEHTRHELSLRGLAEFEYCWVISFFHLNQGFNPLVTPPRGPRKKQGVFATRSPHRPNSIGLSCIRITGVNEREGIVHILGVDLLDGTAVLDIKPYVPYCDAFSDARAGWLDKLNEDMKAPDVLGYHPPPAHLMRPIPPPTPTPTSDHSEQEDSKSKNNKPENENQ